MPATPHCPACNSDTTGELSAVNSTSYVNYYRCDRCGHVWATAKSDPNEVTRHITLKPHKAASGQ